MTKKILIVEDAFIFAEDVKVSLEEEGYYVIGVVSTYQKFFNFIQVNQPDFVILDINLKGEESGISAAKYLYEETNIPFLFITGQGDSATFREAKQYFPVNYLVKPCEPSEIVLALELAFHNEDKLEKKVSNSSKKTFKDLTNPNKTHLVDLKDIYYLESRKRYITYYTSEEYFMETSSLQEALELLPPTFIRIHRNYVVNINRVSSIESCRIILDDDRELEVSRMYRKVVLEFFGE
ncbi:MAG: response regulator transcription factor [Cytophagales bacterium]|nr:response regulator transcription factor [Cytophagales bacterium]